MWEQSWFALDITAENMQANWRGHFIILMNLDKIGQSLWLENVTRESLSRELFREYVEGRVVSGFSIGAQTCKETIRQKDIYDATILRKLKAGVFGKALAVDLVFADTRQAADLLRPVFDRTDGFDGWAVLTTSPLLIAEPSSLAAEAIAFYEKLQRPNVLITIPGLPEYLKSIEEIIFAGVPVNVSMLFSQKQYAAVFESYLAGVEKRITANLKPTVGCFASISISGMAGTISSEFKGAGIAHAVVAFARSIYKKSQELHSSLRWLRAQNGGGRPQRLIWVLDDDSDSNAQEVSYMQYLRAPCTVTVLPERAFKLFIERGTPGETMPEDGRDSEEILSRHIQSWVDFDDLANRLQKSESLAETKAWIELLDTVAYKSAVLTKTIQTDSKGSHQ